MPAISRFPKKPDGVEKMPIQQRAEYLTVTESLYEQAAQVPDPKLCCSGEVRMNLPELVVPEEMHMMNYGCGTTVYLTDLRAEMRVLYVGVGGGKEALEFAYFTRASGSVIAVDKVPRMLRAARRNIEIAAEVNPWFSPDFIDLREGDALDLPLEDESMDLAAQNCLFNIFVETDLDTALAEFQRVLKPGGAICLTDPVTPVPIPDHLRSDHRLRSECLSGALVLEDYLERIVRAGFATVEIRSRRPYRVLDKRRYELKYDILLQSVEIVAYKTPTPPDGPCIFTGRTAIYVGEEESFDDGKGHLLTRDIPASVCDKTARALSNLDRDDLVLTPPTYHYSGGGCC